MSQFSQLKARFCSFRVTDMTRDSIKFELVLEMINPFDAPLNVSSIFYSLKISGAELVASRRVPYMIPVPKDRPTPLTVPVEVEEYERYNFMRRHHEGDFDVEFSVTAEVTIEVQGGIDFKMQVAQNGPVEIPASRIISDIEPDFFPRPCYRFLG